MISSPAKLDPGRCQVCGETADVHVCRTDGKFENHFCFEHAEAAGIPDNPPRLQDAMMSLGTSPLLNEMFIREFLDEIRRMRSFIRQHGRQPSGKEFRNFNVVPANIPELEIIDPGLQKELSQLDGLFDFVEMHRRMPESEDERKAFRIAVVARSQP